MWIKLNVCIWMVFVIEFFNYFCIAVNWIGKRKKRNVCVVNESCTSANSCERERKSFFFFEKFFLSKIHLILLLRILYKVLHHFRFFFWLLLVLWCLYVFIFLFTFYLWHKMYLIVAKKKKKKLLLFAWSINAHKQVMTSSERDFRNNIFFFLWFSNQILDFKNIFLRRTFYFVDSI